MALDGTVDVGDVVVFLLLLRLGDHLVGVDDRGLFSHRLDLERRELFTLLRQFERIFGIGLDDEQA